TSNIRYESSADTLVETSREAGYFSFQLQLQQNGRYDFGRQATARDQAVNIARIETHLVEQVVTCAGFRQPRFGYPCRAEFLENALRALDQLRALLAQRMTAAGERRVDRARDGEHFAALFCGEACSDERPGIQRSLDD